MSKPEIKIGADPELFVFSNGNFISAHDLIPGSKHSPMLVHLGAVQPDGVAAEFNIHPAKTEDEFVFNIASVMRMLGKIVTDSVPDATLMAVPTAVFDQEYFDSLPPEALELGCEPDYDAYTGKANKKPRTSEPFRTGAGHLHIGWRDFVSPFNDDHFDLCRQLVRRLDETLYPLSETWDKDEKRRTLYGKIGSFRPKFYGVEYRPLSNAFLNDEKTIRTAFTVAKTVAEEFFETHEIQMEDAA